MIKVVNVVFVTMMDKEDKTRQGKYQTQQRKEVIVVDTSRK